MVVVSDVGFTHRGKLKKLAQEGFLYGITFKDEEGAKIHTLGWLSRKERRTSQSSGQAECIGAMTSFVCLTHAQVVRECITGTKLPITIVIYSLIMHKTLATQETPKDFAMSEDVHAFRVDYESGLPSTVS